MQAIIIGSGLNTYAKIIPWQGGIVSELVINGNAIIECPIYSLDFRNAYYSSNLFPFQGRIDDGKYDFEGNSYQLKINEPARNNAIHGIVAFEEFKIQNKTENAVTLVYDFDGNLEGYPFPFSLSIEYKLINHDFFVAFKATNTGFINMPCSWGWHPYFTLNQKIDTCKIHLPENQELELNEKMIPTGKILKTAKADSEINLQNLSLDNCYKFVSGKWVEFSADNYTVRLELSESLKYLMIYTPENRKAIAIEPITGNGNCFNNHDDLTILKPSESISGEIKVSIKKYN